MDLDLIFTMAVTADEDRRAVTGPDGRSLRSGELAERARAAAALFAESGATRVAFCDVNGLAFPTALFGAVLARRTFVPLNYRLSDAQLEQIVAGQDILLVASPEQAERLRRFGVERIIESEALLEASAPDADLDVAPVDPNDVALLLYTSGTSAAPKAAVLRHRHLAAYVIGTIEFGSAEPDDAALLSVPPYHIAGVMNLLSNLYMGRRLVYLDQFDPARWLQVVHDESVTHAMVVPTMLARIVDTLGDRPADVPSLRTLSYGGAKMPRPVIERALERFPSVAFTNAYGLTETSSTIAVLGPDDHRAAWESDDPAVQARLGSVGQLLPGLEIEIRDADDKSCAVGEPGDIYVRGEQVAGEYVGATATEGAWFATRDRGFLDEEGYLFIEGRADDTIIRGGENIAPAEIEEALLRHDAVADCAVVGIDDEEWGQRIAAAVILAEGAEATPDELRSFAREQLRGSKTPDEIAIVDALPYTDTGKLLRREVRRQLVEAPTTADA
jgi:acyl-CoA synthetase (AMP-forming)/AMP-acid ligase II